MKEFSVGFYKKLIILVLTAIFAVIFVFGALAIKGFIFDKTEKDKDKQTQQQGQSDTSISSGDDLQKIVDKAEKRKKELEGNKALGNDIMPLDQVKDVEDAENDANQSYAEYGKVVYLSFDDGASKNTEEILQILEENSVRATFFFNTGKKLSSEEIIRKAYLNGNALGVATSMSKSLAQIYESPEAYGQDIDRNIQTITDITGSKPEIIRFPGGSKNAFTNSRYSEFIEEARARGLVYFDWNLCAEGKGYERDLDSLVKNATNIKVGTDRYIVLMHDNGNENTCEALRRIIKFYKEQGFEFMTLNGSVRPIVF